MSTLLEEIKSLLDSPRLRDNLAALFARTLNWGKPQGAARTISAGTPVGTSVTAIPIAQLSGLPVFRIDWPKTTLPTITERRAVYHALASTSIEQLVCYVTSDGKRAAFVWAKQTARHKTELRTLPYEVGAPARTTIERLGELAFTLQELGLLGDPPFTHVLRKLNTAFDVEAVTKKFFERYRELFFKVEEQVTGLTGDARRMFTQKLFNRLMFIVFLERKGWLKLNSRTDYLKALWDAHCRERDTDAAALTFYGDRLKLLFFSGLNAPNEVDVAGINPRGMLATKIGQVPYLNGGLFEEDDDDRNPVVTLPDAALERVIDELFYQFNFTITESTPLDVEVAVDPEMLGKVFEELVTGRHESGSYYTPKPVVAFMCREALKGYLATKVPAESHDALARFVDEHDAQDLHNPEPILEALRQVTVCDPACGSGAYLLGMLQELLQLRAALFVTKQIDARSVYDRKLEIIQNNVYGVDIDPFAVNIARLRLWLSLVVDYSDSNPPPLPNLDYKIEAGDSLLAPDPSATQLSLFRQDVETLFRLKEEFLRAHGAEKRARKAEVDALRKNIAAMTNAHLGDGVLDWQVEFAEVFMRGGFDIVVANPPYVRQELISDLKPALKKVYPEVYSGTADLYCYFYGRAVQLLRSGGMLAFISPNKWFRVDYGANLRKYIAGKTTVQSITDFGDLPVFQAATTYAMIFVAQKGKEALETTMLTQVKTLDEPYPDLLAIIEEQGHTLPNEAIAGADWRLTGAVSAAMTRVMERAPISLSKYVSGQLYYGIKTGFNQAFVIDGPTRASLIAEDAKSVDVIRPLAVGKDIKKWRVVDKDRWLIFTPISIKIHQYPAIFAHLRQWQSELEKRQDQGNHWWELRSCSYYEAFDKPKIIYPQILVNPCFAYDETGTLTNQKCYFITNADKYLLGVLNSSTIWKLILDGSPGLRGGYAEPRKEFILSLPIPDAPALERTAIAVLAQNCLDAKGQGPQVADWEAEINERVARLYGLKPADVV
ncbi:MAG: Eco57I restriction-modification methylase domain-containing protein [Herpetosiphonaceae bacterium]|nr:Eco57I restriction-modification methylase domain-containing protein [Herpetosiphonaceae bacterium]